MNDDTKKRHTGLIVFITLIAGILIGAGGCYYYLEVMTKDNTSKVDTSSNEKKANKTDTEEELNVDGVFVKDLIERYDTRGCGLVYDILYKNDINSISDINQEARTTMAYYNMHGGPRIFSSDELRKSYKKLFGSDTSFTDGDFEADSPCNKYKFNASAKEYTYEEGTGCGCTTASEMLRKIIEAKKDKDSNLTITVAAGVATPSDVSNRNGVISGVDGDFNIETDYEKLDKFKYTFSYDKNNNNYYLVSIKLVS